MGSGYRRFPPSFFPFLSFFAGCWMMLLVVGLILILQ